MFMDNKSLVLMAAKACDEKKAKDIKLIKIDKVSFISEWILIAEGSVSYTHLTLPTIQPV